MLQDTITRTLALLKPDDLFPAWKCIDLMEQQGEIDPEEARRCEQVPLVRPRGISRLVILRPKKECRSKFIIGF